MKIGILPLARPTFDVAYAEEKLAAMLASLDATGHEITGPRALLLDAETTDAAIADLAARDLDRLLILQVTFTDAAMCVHAAQTIDRPLSVWAVPEPRHGGRLRLNAFCGLNLAAHALGLRGIAFSWLYADPSVHVAGDLARLLQGERKACRAALTETGERTPEGDRIAAALKGKRIARIGAHPVGFDTCAYSPDAIATLSGVSVEALPMEALFSAAREMPDEAATVLRKRAENELTRLDSVDQAQLDRSLRLKAGLDQIRAEGGFDAFAIRCWPETFTEYGGAVCGPAAMMGEDRVPCACEADVYGALTQLVLAEAADAPVFLTDLVDIDSRDDTAVIWHCGQAPMSMRDPEAPAIATVHSNRRQPLLYQFPLRPGPVTFLRISQAFGAPKMVIGFGDMLRRPMAFTGTAGVVRFERRADEVMADIIGNGLEHHLALAYGDHRQALRGTAAALGLPILEI